MHPLQKKLHELRTLINLNAIAAIIFFGYGSMGHYAVGLPGLIFLAAAFYNLPRYRATLKKYLNS